ncbi:nucleotidyltransferase domain-containing protein [Sphaerothrix gracilis]|uniref:nucleotidyltransferase family protein n=1 Tax=Sphaerothrix gracilis TaxID=3151835 RepID=UPI0031FCDD83
MALSKADLSAFVAHARQQQARDRRHSYERQQAGMIQAHLAAKTLKQQFGVREVFLFGSLLTPERVDEHSDIDLAVYGLPLEQYCQAVGTLLCQVKGFEVDLVRCEAAQPSLLELIHQEGIRL